MSSTRWSPRRVTTPSWLAVTFLVAFVAAASVSLVVYRRYGTSMDLAIFFQGLANLAGRYPAGVAIKSPGAELFGDHFHPIILMAVPFLRCWTSPVTLLLLQAGAIATTITIVARDWLRARGRVELVPLLALVASPAIWGAACYDFHEVTLGSPLVALTCSALARRRWRQAAALAAGCMLIKEDMGALMLPCAFVLWVAGARKSAAALAAWVLVWSWTVTALVIPAFNMTHRYTYGAGSLLAGMPAAWVHSLLFPGLLTLTTLALLAATGFRFSHPWLLVPALGNIAYRASIDNFRYWIPAYHYWILPFLFVVFAAIGNPRPQGIRRVLVTATVLWGLVAGPATFAVAATAGTDVAATDAAIALVPTGARVAADPRFAAVLSTRSVVSILGPRDEGVPDGVDWVVLDERTRSYGGTSWTDDIVQRLAPAFRPVDGTTRGLVVLHRLVPTGSNRDCVTSDVGTLCLEARELYYDASFTANPTGEELTPDLNLVCRDGVWLGLNEDSRRGPGSLTHSFYVGRTTHDACHAILLVGGRTVLQTADVRPF